jgi:hypothetical protein
MCTHREGRVRTGEALLREEAVLTKTDGKSNLPSSCVFGAFCMLDLTLSKHSSPRSNKTDG